LHIELTRELELGVTYTIQLRPGIRTAAGGTFDRVVESQFTMLSLRLPAEPFPQDGATEESPHVPLAWSPTERSAGPVSYRVYGGSDSAAVAARAVPLLAHTTTAYLYAPNPWAFGRSLYWSVTAVNDSVGERVDGPVWRFDTVSEVTPIDSVDVRVNQFGHVVDERVFCAGVSVNPAPGVNCAVQWRLAEVNPLKLAGARMEFSSGSSNPPIISLYTIVTPWSACEMANPGPPFTDESSGRLAEAMAITPSRQRIESSALTAHIEGTIRGLPLDGYILRTSRAGSFRITDREEPATLRLYFYRADASSARLRLDR
jgi:hypothetical protein